MSDKTGIEWTQATWNPTKGCDTVSPGCDHCYAMTLAPRLKAMGSAGYQLDGDPKTSGPGFLAHEWPDVLDWPLHKEKPLRIFVNSMSDLFHDNITDEFIVRVFDVMANARQHTFQILTKRHARMRSFVTKYAAGGFGDPEINGAVGELPNVWLGVSVENQQWADIRVPALLDTPAAVRFLSCEPLLGPVRIASWLTRSHDCDTCEGTGSVDVPGGGMQCADCGFDVRFGREGIDWVIVGGESGPAARVMNPAWARSLRDQCVGAGVAFFFKQWGEWATRDETMPAVHRRIGKKAAGRELDGRTWDEYPEVTAWV